MSMNFKLIQSCKAVWNELNYLYSDWVLKLIRFLNRKNHHCFFTKNSWSYLKLNKIIDKKKNYISF